MAQAKRKVTKASVQARTRRLARERGAIQIQAAKAAPELTRGERLRAYLRSPEGQMKLLEMQRDVLEMQKTVVGIQVAVAKTRQALAAF